MMTPRVRHITGNFIETHRLHGKMQQSRNNQNILSQNLQFPTARKEDEKLQRSEVPLQRGSIFGSSQTFFNPPSGLDPTKPTGTSIFSSSGPTKPQFNFGNLGSTKSPFDPSTFGSFSTKPDAARPKISEEKSKINQTSNSNQNKCSTEFSLPDPLLRDGAPINGGWVSSTDELCVYACRNPTRENIGTKSDFAPCDSNLHLLKKPNILSDPELRKLVNESQAIFFASRHLSPDEDPKFRTLDRSREHRSSIRVCMEEMHQAMKRNPKVDYEEWICLLENVETIWHLCELLYLEVIQSDVVLPKLLQWCRLSSTEYDEIISEELNMGKGADLRDKRKYWKEIMNLLVEARFDTTRALLRLHSEADSKPFMEADALLRAIPVYSFRCGLSPAEFNARWKSWKTTVRSKISTGTFLSHPELLNLMNILGSNEPLFKLLKPHCPTWYQMLTAVVQFTDPMVRTHDLAYHATNCIEYYGGEAELKLLDRTILALLNGNLASSVRLVKTPHQRFGPMGLLPQLTRVGGLVFDNAGLPLTTSQAISNLLLTADNGLSAVHLSNLLYLRGCLNKSPETTIKLEPLLLDYGLMLMSNKRFWSSGLSYLRCCPVNGKDAIGLKLTSLPLKDNKTILKIVHAAADIGLTAVVSSLCRTVAMQEIKRDCLGGALTWALLSKDVEVLTQIADKYLYKYSTGRSERELNCQNVLSALGQSVFISSRLTFLCKYCDFQKCYQRGEIEEAAAIIIRLLDSKISPKYFWFTLLLDALPILEISGTPIFSNDDSAILLACLEELAIGWIDNPVKKSENFDEQIRNLRLAITKNIARTLLQSNTPKNSNVLICY